MRASKKINAIILLITLVLSLPTGIILVSANAIPGDAFFPLKTSLESIASTIISPSYQARSDLEIKLVQRRIEENQKLLLSSGSTRGLNMLIAQAEAAKVYILESNSSQAAKTAAVSKLINTLQESKAILEEQHRTISAINTIQDQLKHTSSSPISQGNSPTNTPTSEPPEDPDEVLNDIEDTEDDLDEILEDLQNEGAGAAGSTTGNGSGGATGDGSGGIPIDCKWSKWSECSNSCGEGTQYRTRKPRDQNGGKECEGPNEKSCNNGDCYTPDPDDLANCRNICEGNNFKTGACASKQKCNDTGGTSYSSGNLSCNSSGNNNCCCSN